MDDQDVDELRRLCRRAAGRDADAALGGDYPGEPRHLAAGPHRLRAGGQVRRGTPTAEHGDAALGLLERNEELFRRGDRRRRRHRRAGARQAAAAAGRGPAGGLRGRVRRGARTPTRTPTHARACAALRAARGPDDAPGPDRDPLQEPGGPDPAPRAAHPGAGAGRDWPSARRRDLVLTLPKVTSVEQVETLVAVLRADREGRLLQGVGALPFEIQVETPQADPRPRRQRAGRADDPRRRRRLLGLHYGTYDYSAFLGHRRGRPEPGAPGRRPRQGRACRPRPPAPGCRLSDGSTNVLPVGDRAGTSGVGAAPPARATRALHRGFYQGWDLHPAQLPTRFAATFQFFRAGPPMRPIGWRRTTKAGPAPSPTSPRPCAPWPTSSSAGLDCGALTDDEVAPAADRLEAAWRGARRRGGE